MERLSVPFELKFAEGVAEGALAGYGAVFGSLADDEDDGGDVIQKGAFRETLRDARRSGNWPCMLLQHAGIYGGDDAMPIGVWTELREDDTGLYCEGQLAIDTQRGKDAHTLLKMKPRPALTGLSIGFRAKEFAYGTKPGEPRRTLKKVALYEISLVNIPMNGNARITDVKSAAGRVKTIREFEAFLREEGGYSHAAARQIAERGFKSSEPRDEDDAMSNLLRSVVDARAGLSASTSSE